MLFRKENGFSLVEVMILFVVMSAILAASIATISRRSNAVPIKIARGAYICYMDDQGRLHEELFNRKQKISEKVLDEGQSCIFKPIKQASAYQITLIGAGASGFNDFKLENTSEHHDTYFKMKEGFSGYGYGGNSAAAPWESMAVKADGTVIAQVTDDDLWKYYNGEHLTVTASVPKAQDGGDITACFLDMDYCACYEAGKNNKLSRPYSSKYGVWAVNLYSPYEDLTGSAIRMICPQVPSDLCKTTNDYDYYYGPKTAPIDSALNVNAFIKGNATVPDKEGVCTGTSDLQPPLSWGGEWYCACKNRTIEGEAGGAGGYITKTVTIGNDSLQNAYSLDGSASQYQNVLKKFATNMKKGICASSTDNAACTFKDGTAKTPGGNKDINLGNSSQRKAYCSGGICMAPNGDDVDNRVAILYPDSSNNATNVTAGYSIKHQTKTAKGGNGAIVQLHSEGNGRDDSTERWEQLDYDERDNYVAPADADGVEQSAESDYRPMLTFTSELVHRHYTYGPAGGNGVVKVNTRTSIKGNCNIIVGQAGPIHTGANSTEYNNYVTSGAGNTSIACADDGYTSVAAGGQPNSAYNTDEYYYKYANKDKTQYDVTKGSVAEYETPVALMLLVNRGLPNIQFGKGGDGVTMHDRCIQPSGSFQVKKSNEFGGDIIHTYVNEKYDDPGCYVDGGKYGTVMENVTNKPDGSITSRYLDINAAKQGSNGAVIITW